ncbi:hypothetical protein [Arthrobacter sp. Cr_A7]|uniref:hypothetical protein n=1 Tax=Arthrobacter sp. Cr_A7 TaxID=3031017 RepID=UPI0023DAEBB0|nr:hypothetical protein [Arthrobacter sp. Cr_A7]MDF2048417.1 hypothetical protein [Arthrobacter sp. Cr_A7]
MFGVDGSAATILQPEVAILGVGGIIHKLLATWTVSRPSARAPSRPSPSTTDGYAGGTALNFFRSLPGAIETDSLLPDI